MTDAGPLKIRICVPLLDRYGYQHEQGEEIVAYALSGE
jgi:hypothetical protein